MAEQEKPVQEAPVAAQEPQNLEVPMDVAINVRLMEFDKQIADSKAQTAVLEQQKMQFIFDTNIKMIQNKYAQPAAPEAAKPENE